jgi:hypothetical protein
MVKDQVSRRKVVQTNLRYCGGICLKSKERNKKAPLRPANPQNET